MLRIKKLFPIIIGVLLLLSCNSSIEAYEVPTGWSNSQQEVFAKAKAEGKYIFLFGGRSTCPNCQKTLSNIADAEVQSIIEKNYVLWYIDWDSVKQSTNQNFEGKYYVNKALAAGIKFLPALYIIDPNDSENILRFESEYHDINTMKLFLTITGLPPVANEHINPTSNKVSFSANTLSISNDLANETITVYTVAGQTVSSLVKKGATETFDATSFPKGVLIIRSSEGWTAKALNR
mgnify:CR=1 FL=1